jgi:GDP-L-fucose synthase
MKNRLKIFVTGGSGFLGRNLLGALKTDGHFVVAPTSRDCNLLDSDSLADWNLHTFDRIYHLAAWTQAGDFCLKHPGEQWIKNQKLNTNVLAWWAERQPQAKLVTIGTSCAYSPELPLVEENYLYGQPVESLYTYAQTKRMLWIGQLALANQFGLKHLSIVPSTLYGPNYHTDGRQPHFIFDLLRKIINGKRDGSPVVLWGDGYQKRELVHIDDFVRIALELSDLVDNEIVNVGAGEEYSIRYFAEIISEAINFEPTLIRYDTSKYVGAKSKCLDILKLKRIIPDYLPIKIKAGLLTVIRWIECSGALLDAPTHGLNSD